MNVQQFTVIGAGQMGSGIAQVAAQAGLQVKLHDIEDAMVQKGLQGIKTDSASGKRPDEG